MDSFFTRCCFPHVGKIREVMELIVSILRSGNVRLTTKMHPNGSVTYMLETWRSRGLGPCEFTRADLRDMQPLIQLILDQVPGDMPPATSREHTDE